MRIIRTEDQRKIALPGWQCVSIVIREPRSPAVVIKALPSGEVVEKHWQGGEARRARRPMTGDRNARARSKR